MDVSHDRAWRHPAPWCGPRRLNHSLYVYRIGRHHQLSANAFPSGLWPVGVYLDSQVVGILEIEGFADQVITRTCPDVQLSEVTHESAERGAVG